MHEPQPSSLVDATIRPFRIEVPDGELVALRDRLAGVRWAPEPDDDDGSYGVTRDRVQALVAYWRDRYDWRTWEAQLNEHPQFTTTIDGTTVHFLHIRSSEPDAFPLILSHGWPGSIAEYLPIIGPLAHPRSHGVGDGIAFDLVIPSLPGSGFSGPTPDTGWGPRRIAHTWATLMQRLGYERYGAVGNDWGSFISPELGRVASDAVVGVHVTQLFSAPTGEIDPEDLSPADRAALDGWRYVDEHLSSYSHVHAEQPQTLAHALSDSPVGLLGWNCQVMDGLDPEDLLTHVSIHWLTGTAGSALRIYAEQARQPIPDGPTTAPLALAQFPNDLPAIRAYAERDHANIVSWNVYDRGGHYAAQQAPDLLTGDIRAFFTAINAGLPMTAPSRP